MVRVLSCSVLAIAFLALSGCSTWASYQQSVIGINYPHAHGETTIMDSEEHYRVVSKITARDARALVDDLDLFFQTDRPTRLSRWHDR